MAKSSTLLEVEEWFLGSAILTQAVVRGVGLLEARGLALILGGNKTGDDRFYEWIIPQSERIWERYLQELS